MLVCGAAYPSNCLLGFSKRVLSFGSCFGSWAEHGSLGDYYLPRDSCAGLGLRLSPHLPLPSPYNGRKKKALPTPVAQSVPGPKGASESLAGPGRSVLTDSTTTPLSACVGVGFGPPAPPGTGRSRLREAPPPARPRPGVQIRCGRAAGDAGGS